MADLALLAGCVGNGLPESGASNPRDLHVTYPRDAPVQHPLVHPDLVSQGMQKGFWRTLYRETLRFLVRGQVVPDLLLLEEPPSESELDEGLRIPGPNVESCPEHSGGPF